MLGATAACSPSPIIDPSKAPTPQPTPTLDDQRHTAAQLELDLAAACAAVADQFSGARREWFAATAQAHQARHTVLAQRDPFAGVQADHTPIADFQPSTLPTVSADQVAQLAQRATEQLVDLMSQQAEPQRALLLASCAAATTFTARHALAEQAPLPVAGQTVPAPVEFGSHVETLQLLLGHLQALEFGLETLTGKTANQPASEQLRAQLRVRLASTSTQVDRLRQLIVQAGSQPTPAAAQYQRPVDGDDSAKRATWGKLEANVAAAWAAVVATTEPAQRQDFFDEFVPQLQRAQELGQPLTYWPGWQ